MSTKEILDAFRLHLKEEGISTTNLEMDEFIPRFDDWAAGRGYRMRRNPKATALLLGPQITPELAMQVMEEHDMLEEDGHEVGNGLTTELREPGDTRAPEEPGEPYAEDDDDYVPYWEDMPDKRVVIFVPGILGSEIYLVKKDKQGNKDVKIVWPPVTVDPAGPAPLDKLMPPGSGESKKCVVLHDAYAPLLSRLHADGYTEANGKLIMFGYDWTISNDINGAKLAKVIAKVKKKYGDGCAIDIIAHSMGGLVSRAAIEIHKASVRKVAFVATPHWGSPKAYFALHTDTPDPIIGSMWKQWIADIVFQKISPNQDTTEKVGQQLRKLAREFPSVYELLPDKNYFDRQKGIVIIDWKVYADEEVTSLERTYWDAHYSQWGVNIRFDTPGMRKKAQDAMDFKNKLAVAPAMNHVCIYADDQETNDKIVFHRNNVWFNGFGNPYDSGQHGDGTVPTASASAGNSVKHSGTHVGLPNDQAVYLTIKAQLGL